jgi:hypothetical protein
MYCKGEPGDPSECDRARLDEGHEALCKPGAELHWGELGQPPQLDLSVLKYLLSSSVTFSSSGGFNDSLDGAAAVWLLVVLSKVDDNVSTCL